MPAPITVHVCARVSEELSGAKILRARCVIVQKRNRIVKPLAMLDMAFTVMPTFSGFPNENRVNIRASIMNRGAPGGCPTSSLYDVAMNSMQSHRLPVGSMVSR